MIAKILTTLFLISAAAHAETPVKTVKMSFEGKNYLHDVYSSARASGKQPAVILVPEYWGKDDLYTSQAEWLAQQGYVVMVMDIYGDGNHSTQTAKAEKLQSQAETSSASGPKITELLNLIGKSIQELKNQPGVDANRIAAVGFGYGGGLVMNYAKLGNTPGLKAVVSYYGGVKKILPVHRTASSPALLYIRAGYDSYTQKNSYAAFVNEMKKEKLSLEVLELKDAHYGFVHRQIANYGSDTGQTLMYYNPRAASQARTTVQSFLQTKLK